jgi:hypothetical protein
MDRLPYNLLKQSLEKDRKYSVCHVQVKFMTRDYITFSKKVYDQQEMEVPGLEQKYTQVEQDIPRGQIFSLYPIGNKEKKEYCVVFIWRFDEEYKLNKDFVNYNGN